MTPWFLPRLTLRSPSAYWRETGRRCWTPPPSNSLFHTPLPRPPLRRRNSSCLRHSDPDADWLWWGASARGSRLTTAVRAPWNSSTSSGDSGTRFSPGQQEEEEEEIGGKRAREAERAPLRTNYARELTRLKQKRALTCESFRPSLEASFFLSGLLMYFCFWNIFSKALRCTSENTALLSIPLRGFPLAARGHEKVPGMGTTDEEAAKQAEEWLVFIYKE